MAPARRKKKNNAASKSTSKQEDLDRKSWKKGAKTDVGAESTSEEVVSDKKIVEDEKDGDGKESVPTPVVKKKPCTWLKLDRLDPQTGSKSSLESSKQGKEAKSTTQVQDIKDNKRKRKEQGGESGNHDSDFRKKHTNLRLERKEKGIISDRNEDTKKRDEDTGKRIISDRIEDRKKRDEESGKSLGGLIFMCNAKTKPDCLRYQLMGVPASKKEVVMSIKPGLKLFLYDYDLKLMYGIYEASSCGGMKLETAAFGGGFPAQVRFTVHKDCLPLPENVFLKAIKDSYDERTRKFKTELTVKQVKHLMDLFRPTPGLGPNCKPVVHEGNPNIYLGPASNFLTEESLREQGYLNNYGVTNTGGMPMSIPLYREKQFSDYHVCSNTARPEDPLFLTGQEYRSNDLQQGRHLLPGDVSQSSEPNKLDHELKHLLKNPASTSFDSAVQQRDINQPDPFFLSEKEYRIYGLGGRQQKLNAVSTRMTTNDFVRDSACDPYDESTTSLVNRYLALPMNRALSAETYHHPGRSPYMNDLNDMKTHPTRTRVPDVERASAPYTLGEQSEFNQRAYSLSARCEPSEPNQGICLQRETDLTSAPVSQRYSFAGPSLSQHR